MTGDVKFTFPLSLVQEQVLGRILLKCEDFINQNRTPEQFWKSLEKDKTLNHILDQQAESCLVSFYKEIQALNNRKPPWDSIWCRIVKTIFHHVALKILIILLVIRPGFDGVDCPKPIEKELKDSVIFTVWYQEEVIQEELKAIYLLY